jgi:hypothetical protein
MSMQRTAALLSGLALVVGAGWVHGLWTQRWARSAGLDAAVARMADLPDDLDGWKAEPAEEDREALDAAGAEGWWVRRYTNPRTGAAVQVLLLCGRGGRMCVHRPEHCYGGAGYEMDAEPQRCPVGGAEFRTACFRKAELGGPINLRIFWSWFDGSSWQAPDNPRWSLAQQPYLYKLYVIREVPEAAGKAEDDPAAGFLRLLVPALERGLSGA